MRVRNIPFTDHSWHRKWRRNTTDDAGKTTGNWKMKPARAKTPSFRRKPESSYGVSINKRWENREAAPPDNRIENRRIKPVVTLPAIRLISIAFLPVKFRRSMLTSLQGNQYE
jgi:hypothetical protein